MLLLLRAYLCKRGVVVYQGVGASEAQVLNRKIVNRTKPAFDIVLCPR